MASEATSSTPGDAAKEAQIAQLKSHLKTIMEKQEELKTLIAAKHDRAETARRLSTQMGGSGGSLRNVMVEREDHSQVDVVETPGIQKRLNDYSHNVEELEKELEATTKLVNEVAAALQVLSATST